MSGFCHLHLHTEYSLLDGAIKIKDLASRLKEMGMTSCAITDHGVMYGAVSFYREMKANGIDVDALDALSLAGYVCEVIAECGTAEPDGELMRLGLNTLYALSKGSYSVPLVKAAFEIRCASILGFMPDIFGCHRCGREDGAMFYLDIMAGAVECYECHKLAEGKKELLSEVHEAHLLAVLSPAVRRALEYCVCCPPEKLFSFKLTEEDTELLSVAAERYLLNHLERGFRSLDFYNEVKA